MCNFHNDETSNQDKIDILESILDKGTFKALKDKCNTDKESMISLAVEAIEIALDEADDNQLDDESMYEELDKMDDNFHMLLIIKIPCMFMTLLSESGVYEDLADYCDRIEGLMYLYVIQAIKNELGIASKKEVSK